MNIQVLRHLIGWEVRHSLRGASFYTMLLIAAAAPAALLAYLVSVAPAMTSTPERIIPHLDLSMLVPVQITVLSVLVTLWMVFSVKRLMATDVSDDWLLVVTYRQALVSRYLAGLRIGFVLYLASALGGVLALAVLSPTQIGEFVGMQPYAIAALLQPLAMASILVAAADFLVAGLPVVLFVLMVLDLLWCWMPGLGFAAAAFARAEVSAVAGVFLALAATVLCLLLIRFGWQRAEDFWAYLGALRREQGGEASLGEVRTIVNTDSATRRSAGRDGAALARQRLAARGVEPIPAHDLARYPWFNARAMQQRDLYMPWLVGAVVVGVVALFYHEARPDEAVGLYLGYFTWWILAVTVVFRTVSSAAQIVVQEREQGTLEAWLTMPHGARRMLASKLGVVVRQALPGLLILTAALPVLGLWIGLAAPVWIAAAAATVAGTLASALSGSRLQAMLLALAGGAAVMWPTALAHDRLLDLPAVSSALSALPPAFLRAGLGSGLGQVALGVATAAVVAGVLWLLARPLAERALFREVNTA